ncbi:MAG: hypothetical protein OXN21_12275 [Chloroflexota bacterium]|nr:hypothetical protein [Chloroflexota bacterium]
MTAGRGFLRDIGAQSNEFERLFFEWIESYNGEGDLDILEAFGETMLALDRFVDCGWGCDDDHPEKHLVATCISGIRAILLLTACGNPSEANALFRPLGETVNLMALLALSRDELQAYRLGNKRQRRDQFEAARVRGVLKRVGFTAPQSARMYGMLSNFYLHPNALDHIFSYRTSQLWEGFVIPYFHRDQCISMFINLVSAASTALLFWSGTQMDDSDIRLAHALNERTDKAIRSFTANVAQDPTAERVPIIEAAQPGQ